MKFMVLVKATAASEAGEMPSAEMLTAMGAYNQRLLDAGVLVAGEGLHPSSKGVRVRFSGDERAIVDGPFAETKELLAGFWIFNCASLQEAIDWIKQAPMPEDNELEIRQIFAPEDFTTATPEILAHEARMRASVEGRQ